MNATFKNWLDGMAMSASGLCLLHCLLLPIAIILLPAMAAATDTTELIHLLSLVIVIPTSLVALSTGNHAPRPAKLFLTGCAALILLVLGAFFEEAGIWGVLLTGAGSLLLILCHLRNWQWRSIAIEMQN